MSTGLFTASGNYAQSEELLALAGVWRRHFATYATRTSATETFNAVRGGTRGFLASAKGAGVRLCRSPTLKLSGTDNWGDVPSLLSMISEAKERGVDHVQRSISLHCRHQAAVAQPAPRLGAGGRSGGHAPAIARRRSAGAHAG